MIALQSLISLLLLLWIVGMYNDYRVDRLRHDLFELRNRLFDEAASGKIAFDSRGYQAARDMCNGLIRFGHTVSVLKFFTFRAVVPKAASAAASAQFEEFIGSLEDNERAITLKYMEQANVCVIWHIVRSPYVLLTIVAPLAIWAGFDLCTLAIKRFSGALRSLDALALSEGRKVGVANDLTYALAA